MPSRNVLKEFAAGEYYHVYNRGVEKRIVFLDDQDYTVFLGLLKKYLSGEVENITNRHAFDNLAGEAELLAYCLMPNHFHLLIYQHTETALTRLMRRIMTGYVMYFNNRYHRVGTLFQGRYKAARIDADTYLHHISRYIHMNPSDYRSWQYSSLPYYLGAKRPPSWLKPGKVMDLFTDSKDYETFLKDYQEDREELTAMKWQLANASDL